MRNGRKALPAAWPAGHDDGMTNERQQIVAGYDGSEAAAAAAEWAATESIRRGCPLTIVGCFTAPVVTDFGMSFGALAAGNLEDLRAAVDRDVAGLVERLTSTFPQLQATGITCMGPARRALVDHAAGADLLVVGATGAGEVGALMLGSVAFAVSRTSPCPVVVVPRGDDASSRRHIVVGVDTLDFSREAVDWAADEADLFGARLTVVHAWSYPYAAVPPDSEAYDRMRVDAALELDRAVEHLRQRSGADISGHLAEGDPADVILEAAGDADLVVIGSRGRGSLRALFLGSTSNAVITHAPCPTVIVRHKG